MKRNYILWMSLLLGLWMGCDTATTPIDEPVQSLIEQAKTSGERLNFDQQLNEIEWTELIVLPPYSSMGRLSAKGIDFEKSGLQDARIEERDDICVLVFVNEQEIVAWTKVKRATADFGELGRDWPRIAADFQIQDGEVTK